MTKSTVISGTGIYYPEHIVTNEQLVQAFNDWVGKFNDEHADEIAAGTLEAKQPSSAEFIEKASGIKARYAMFPDGMLDVDRMMTRIPKRSDDELSEMAEMAVAAGRQALERAGKTGADIDMVICAASTMQRPWPAIGVEIQNALGCGGFAFDMSVACSSATFATSIAMDAISSGMATCALVVDPEFATPQLNLRDRDSHFIFGDVCTALVIEREETANPKNAFRIVDRRLHTEFSNNIRGNFGFVTRAREDTTPETYFEPDQFFVQNGPRVFRELLPLVVGLVKQQLADLDLSTDEIKRMWLHQANINMNNFAAKHLLGQDPEPGRAPIVLDEFANTASAGSIIAFHRTQDDFKSGEKGLLCSFGAGYSVGSIVLEKV